MSLNQKFKWEIYSHQQKDKGTKLSHPSVFMCNADTVASDKQK